MKKKTVCLKEAIQILNEAHGIDPEIAGRSVLTIGALYNAIHKKLLKRHGPFHLAMVETEELLRLYGPKRVI